MPPPEEGGSGRPSGKRWRTASGALLGLAIALQVGWGEVHFIRSFRESVSARAAPAGKALQTPAADFALAHVPAGRPIVYVTSGHGIPELFSYYELSYALTPRNAVWWAADGRPTSVVDWWSDASTGTPALLQLARRRGSSYLLFAGRPPPADLPSAETWRADPVHVLIRLREE